MPRPPGPLALRKTYDNQRYADALQLMLNRMASRVESQGPIEAMYPIPHRAHRLIQDRVDMYLGSGDRQFLIDAANLCLIEYLQPSVPDAWEESREGNNS